MPGRSLVKKYFSELCVFSDENEVDDGYDEGMTSSSAADSQGDLVPSPESPPTNNKYGLQCKVLSGFNYFITPPHRAMFKLGGKNLFVLCLLVKNLSAVYSADRCDF